MYYISTLVRLLTQTAGEESVGPWGWLKYLEMD